LPKIKYKNDLTCKKNNKHILKTGISAADDVKNSKWTNKTQKGYMPTEIISPKNFINAKNNSTNLKKCNGPILKSDH